MKIENRGFKLAVLGLFIGVCFAMFLFLYVSAGGQRPFSSHYEVKAVLPTSFNLVENGDVRTAGVKIGKVTDITNKGPNGLVTFQIDDDHKPLYQGATVALRTKTLVGENYLDVNLGDPKKGEISDGDTLPMSASDDEAVQLDQILDTLDARTRAEIRKNLDGLGPGFEGRGEDVNRLFAAVNPTVLEGQAVASVLRQKRSQTAALVDDTAKVLQAFGDRTAQVRTLAKQAKVTAEVVSDRDEQFGAAIDELDPTLRQARFTADNLAGFSRKATPIIRDVKIASRDLRPLMKDLRPATALARETLNEIPPLSKELDPLLTSLRKFSPELQKAIQPLDSVLREANPALAYLAPYQREIATFFGNVGSALDTEDSVSSMARVHVMAGPANVSGILTANMLKALNSTLDATTISKYYTSPRRNAYSKPGTNAKPNGESNYRRVTADQSALRKKP